MLDDVAERENGETRTDRAIHRSPPWGEQGDGGKTGGAEECETRACEVTLRCVTRRFVALRTIARNFTSDSMLGYIDRVDKPVVGLSRDLRDISSTRPAIVLMRTILRARACTHASPLIFHHVRHLVTVGLLTSLVVSPSRITRAGGLFTPPHGVPMRRRGG